MASPLPPEPGILLALARPQPGEPEILQLKELIEPDPASVDWGRIARLAAHHQVAPALGVQGIGLSRAGAVTGMDQAVLYLLRASYQATRRANEIMLRQMAEIADAADAAGIVMAVRKGGQLACTVYPDPGLRQMGDLDVLVAREDVPALVRVLVELGYRESHRTADTLRPYTRREQLFWHIHGSSIPKLCKELDDRDHPIMEVDISVCLTLPGTGFDIPVPEVLDHLISHDMDGRRFKTLSSVDTLIDLTAHIYKTSTVLRFMRGGARHRKLRKYIDLCQVIRAAGEPAWWDRVLDRVLSFGADDAVCFGLTHLDLLYPGEVPRTVLETLRERCSDPDRLLDRYGQWDLPQPAYWEVDAMTRFFDPSADRALPASRALI